MESAMNMEGVERNKKVQIDPRVKVRFGFFTREGERLNDVQIDQKLREYAQADAPGASVSDLIKRMVKEFAYGQSRLSLQEFIDRFKKNRLDEIMAAKFANSLLEIDTDPHLSPTLSNHLTPSLKKEAHEQVKNNIIEFLEKYNLTNAETLFEFLKQQKADWPMVEIGQLFLEEYAVSDKEGNVKKLTLRQKVSDKIKGNIDRIADEAFQEKFNEDKRGFVMGFMMGRVIKYDAKKRKMVFDGLEFRKLMGYLDNNGFSINRINGETLYDWLYYDSRQMAAYIQEQRLNAVKFGVREAVAKTGVLEESPTGKIEDKLFFDEDFDVKAFHDRYIKPAYFKFYSKKLRKLKKVREPDILHKMNDPENLGQQNHTVQLMRYIDTLVATSKDSPGNFMAKVRELFGLNGTPLMRRLSNKDVQEYFDYCFEKAEEKFTDTVKDALVYRSDDAIKIACAYPKEILKCRDLARLLEWFKDPEAFKVDYPEYVHWPNDQIAFACSAFVRDFLRVSKRLSGKQFQNAVERRDILEKYMRKTLDIKELKSFEVNFRLLEEVDEKGNSYAEKPYELVYDPKDIMEFDNGLDRGLRDLALNTNENFIDFNGKKYRVYPKERKSFKKVTMRIPNMPMKEGKDGKSVFGKVETKFVHALIYTGDKHLIHVKDEIGRVSAEDRGKEVSDENRWMLVFTNDADMAAFRDYIYSTHARSLVKADDPAEGRDLSVKSKKTKRSKKSQEFKASQDASIVKTFTFPEENPVKMTEDGKPTVPIQMVDTMLETQCQNLKSLLIKNLSDYSDTSHNLYRAERAWPLLFSLYFPPEYFGDIYKGFKDEGFKSMN